MTERQAWLLLFLGSEAGSHPVDQVRAMKGMFLIDQELFPPDRRLYRFDAYDYGPFDSTVYRDLDSLKISGKVEITPIPGSNRRIYALSNKGQEAFDKIASNKSASEMDSVQKIKKRVTSLGFEDLLREIYQEYPAYAVNSRARLIRA